MAAYKSIRFQLRRFEYLDNIWDIPRIQFGDPSSKSYKTYFIMKLVVLRTPSPPPQNLKKSLYLRMVVVSLMSGGPYGPRGGFILFVKCQYNLYVCIGYILPIIGRNMSVGGFLRALSGARLGNMYIL